MATRPPAPVGIFVLAGGQCALELTADGLRKYTNDCAIITSVAINVNRRDGIGSIECGFICSGTVVPA